MALRAMIVFPCILLVIVNTTVVTSQQNENSEIARTVIDTFAGYPRCQGRMAQP